MHILVIPSWYPTSENPYNGNFVKRHVELLARKHELSVLYFSPGKLPETRVEITQNGRLKSIHVHYPKKSNKIGQFFSLKKAFKQALQEIRQPDLVHVHVMLDRGVLGIWAKNYFQKPLLITEHGSYLFRENYKKLSSRQKMTIIQSLKHASRVSCVSKVLEDELRYLFPRVKTCLTPNVIDRELFSPTDKTTVETTRFIHISTLEAMKNGAEIIRAFELLNQEQPDFTLQIICEKENEDIRAQIAATPVRDKIKLHGPIPVEEVAAALQQSDALVMLSSYETFSCVIAEAWSCGKPIISTPVGIAQNMPPEAGILVSGANSKVLLEALKRFIMQKNSFDPQKIRRLSEAYSEEAVLESFDHFYSPFLP